MYVYVCACVCACVCVYNQWCGLESVVGTHNTPNNFFFYKPIGIGRRAPRPNAPIVFFYSQLKTLFGLSQILCCKSIPFVHTKRALRIPRSTTNHPCKLKTQKLNNTKQFGSWGFIGIFFFYPITKK